MRRLLAHLLFIAILLVGQSAQASFSGLYVGQYGNPVAGLWIGIADTNGQLRGLGGNLGDSAGFTFAGTLNLQSGQAAATASNGAAIAFTVGSAGQLTSGTLTSGGASAVFLGEIANPLNPREPGSYSGQSPVALDDRLLQYVGNYEGAFTGTSAGSFILQVDTTGVVDGLTFTAATGRVAIVDGLVTSTGGISLTTNAGDSFAGNINAAGAASGAWQNASQSGTFQAAQTLLPQLSFFQPVGNRQFAGVSLGSLSGSYGYGPSMLGSGRSANTILTPAVRCAAAVAPGGSPAALSMFVKGLSQQVSSLALYQSATSGALTAFAYQAGGSLSGGGQWALLDAQGNPVASGATLSPGGIYQLFFAPQDGSSGFDNNATPGTLEATVLLANVLPVTATSGGGGGGGGGCALDPAAGASLGLEWLLLPAGLGLWAWRARRRG